jgi:hypoxanthine phosphoribosyltransferase
VVIVEDIVDTGRTLHYLVDLLRARGPLGVECCALVRKPSMAKVAVEVRYVGFDMDPVWVVGYGLDYNEQHRTLPYIGELSPNAIERGQKK